ncbi:hypothetical protein AG1IA_06938 [Rhizoctonia solani AG-1 IA]|uniref:Uncharacterized protein n=1 Tax=Thanatephorus cucumeris (strain AG1-IA) TaxID=983506 RepID=L8WQG1_THACA|nr:hypothetical protein AG1IA_06938 [Rhizoctonia solani AG-1 IA]
MRRSTAIIVLVRDSMRARAALVSSQRVLGKEEAPRPLIGCAHTLALVHRADRAVRLFTLALCLFVQEEPDHCCKHDSKRGADSDDGVPTATVRARVLFDCAIASWVATRVGGRASGTGGTRVDRQRGIDQRSKLSRDRGRLTRVQRRLLGAELRRELIHFIIGNIGHVRGTDLGRVARVRCREECLERKSLDLVELSDRIRALRDKRPAQFLCKQQADQSIALELVRVLCRVDTPDQGDDTPRKLAWEQDRGGRGLASTRTGRSGHNCIRISLGNGATRRARCAGCRRENQLGCFSQERKLRLERSGGGGSNSRRARRGRNRAAGLVARGRRECDNLRGLRGASGRSTGDGARRPGQGSRIRNRLSTSLRDRLGNGCISGGSSGSRSRSLVS